MDFTVNQQKVSILLFVIYSVASGIQLSMCEKMRNKKRIPCVNEKSGPRVPL